MRNDYANKDKPAEKNDGKPTPTTIYNNKVELMCNISFLF